MPGVDGGGPGAPPTFAQPEIVLAFGDDFQWVVPGLVLTFPGFLLVLVVVLQAVGALAWVPIVRRRLGGAEVRVGPNSGRTPRVPAGH
jgi:hypothetical protein